MKDTTNAQFGAMGTIRNPLGQRSKLKYRPKNRDMSLLLLMPSAGRILNYYTSRLFHHNTPNDKSIINPRRDSSTFFPPIILIFVVYFATSSICRQDSADGRWVTAIHEFSEWKLVRRILSGRRNTRATPLHKFFADWPRPIIWMWFHNSVLFSYITSMFGTVLQIGRSLVRFQMVSLEFFIDIILPIALWPWGRLSL